MVEWRFAQTDAADELAVLQHFSVKKQTPHGDVEFVVTVKEYATPKQESMRYFAIADKERVSEGRTVCSGGLGPDAAESAGRMHPADQGISLRARRREIAGGVIVVSERAATGGALMAPKLSYAIKFVADMDKAVAFYRDTVGLAVKFQSPEWTEFLTGETTLALHKASGDHPAGSVELGFAVPSLDGFYSEMTSRGVRFSEPPAKQPFGGRLARFEDCEKARCTVSGG